MTDIAMNDSAQDATNSEAVKRAADDAEPPELPDNKAILRWRVEVRMGELEKLLTTVQMPSDRGHELVASLEFARRHMRGDWSHVSDSAIAELSAWLDRSEELRVTNPGLPIIQCD